MVSAKGSQRPGTTAWLTPGYNVTSHTVTSLLTVWVWASVTCAEWSLKSLTSWVLFTVTCGSYGEWAITINPYWGGGAMPSKAGGSSCWVKTHVRAAPFLQASPPPRLGDSSRFSKGMENLSTFSKWLLFEWARLMLSKMFHFLSAQ